MFLVLNFNLIEGPNKIIWDPLGKGRYGTMSHLAKFLPYLILWRLNQRFSTQITPRPVFWRKKFPRPETEDFPHFKIFLKASFTLLSAKNIIPTTRLKSSTTRLNFLHDPLPGRDPSVEKHWLKHTIFYNWLWSNFLINGWGRGGVVYWTLSPNVT